MKKLLIISGPTASGKTSLAFFLAKKFSGELISADSRQVYKGMDVVTGKEINKDVKTWLLDVVDPNQPFTVADYYQLAWKVTKDIWHRKKLPILVGGTGFYIKAVIDGVGTMGIEPDFDLRQELDQLTVEELGKRLQKVDKKRWERMNVSDRKNPRRLTRALEVAKTVKMDHLNTVQYLSKNFDVLWLGLRASFTVLYKRIDQRVDERLHLGAVEETKRLAKKFGWDVPSMTGQGYRELRGFVEGQISLEEAAQRWKFAEHEYARKQMTWFKKEKRIVWFDLADKKFRDIVEKRAREWYYR